MRTNGKVIGAILLTLILVMSFATEEAQGAGQVWQWPDTMTMTTTGSRTGTFASTTGIAAVLEKTTGSKVRVIPEGTSALRYEKLYKKMGDFGCESSGSHETSITGNRGGFVSRELIGQRIFWLHYDAPWGYVVRGDSPLKTIYDLKKKKGIRVSVNTSIPVMIEAVKLRLPAFLGMSQAEADEHFVWVPCSRVSQNVLSVSEGKADVGYGASSTSSVVEAAAGPHGIRYLELPLKDKEAWIRFQNNGGSVSIPTVVTYGAKPMIGAQSFKSFFTFNVTEETDATKEEFVYQLTKWFHHNYDAYKGVHVNASRANLKNFREYLDTNSMPIANGCIRYLKEIGKWTSGDDKRQEKALKLEKRWFAARRAVKAEADAKKIKISHRDDKFVKIYQTHTKGIPFFVMKPSEK